MPITEQTVEIKIFVIKTAGGTECKIQAVAKGEVVSLTIGNQTIALSSADLSDVLNALTQADLYRTHMGPIIPRRTND